MVPYTVPQNRSTCSDCSNVCSCDPVYGFCKFFKKKHREQDSVINFESYAEIRKSNERLKKAMMKTPLELMREKLNYKAIQESHKRR